MKTNTTVFVQFEHNHPVMAADALRFRKPSEKLKEKFIGLFQNGYTPATAIQAHNLDIIIQNPENYEVLLADNSQCPNYQWASRLYRQQAESSYGSRSLSVKQQAEYVLNLAASKGCTAKLVEDGNEVAIILITKMMARISTMLECGENCFVDSSGGVDKDGTRFFIFLGRCQAGGVPLGVILTTSECESLLTAAFQAFKEILPLDAFGGRSNICGPQVFMTDDSAAERNALRCTWPNSVLLLCIFHVLQALWRWLLDGKHKIGKKDRPHLFNIAKKMLYATSEHELNSCYENHLSDIVVKKYPNYVQHVSNVFERKNEWALCFRQNLSVRGNNTNNVCESVMMIMKDYVLQRVKAFNAVQLADFVISRLDLYFEQKILNVAFNRLSNVLATKNACLQRNVDFAKNNIVQISNNIYSVPSESDSSKHYDVNMDLARCECFVGKDGNLCKHQIAVAMYMGVSNSNMLPITNPKQKQYLYNIATGKTMELSFFQSLRQNNELNNESNLQKPTENQSHCTLPEVATSDEIESNNNDFQIEINQTESEIRSVIDDLLVNLKTKPELYTPAIQKFAKSYKTLTTDANRLSALHCFGKTLGESSYSSSILSVKRKGKKIHVQPTAIARRQTMTLGKGSKSSAGTGRPRCYSHLKGHDYATNHRQKKAPHNLSRCVSSNCSLGKSH